MDIKLKPCPFCGGEALKMQIKSTNIFKRNRQYAYVECAVCRASTGLHDNELRAGRAWNMRKEE